MRGAIVFDFGHEDGAREAFLPIVEDMDSLLVAVTPAGGGPACLAPLAGGRADDDAARDQLRTHRVDEHPLEPSGEPE